MIMEYCSGNSIVGAKKKKEIGKKKPPKNNRVNTRSSHVRAAAVLTGREYTRESPSVRFRRKSSRGGLLILAITISFSQRRLKRCKNTRGETDTLYYNIHVCAFEYYVHATISRRITVKVARPYFVTVTESKN